MKKLSKLPSLLVIHNKKYVLGFRGLGLTRKLSNRNRL